MSANDPSPREFAKRLKSASKAKRGYIANSYKEWVFAGARAQGVWQWGGLILGGSIFLAVDTWVVGLRSPLLLGVCAAGIATGGAAVRIALKREREWRRANPWTGPRSR